MSSLFVNSEEVVSAKIYVGTKNDNIFSSESKESLLDWYKIPEENISEYNISFLCPDFKASIDISSEIFRTTQVDGQYDPILIRYTKILRLLRKWDFKDDEGKDIPVNKENIDKLHPQIANSIAIVLESLLPGF